MPRAVDKEAEQQQNTSQRQASDSAWPLYLIVYVPLLLRTLSDRLLRPKVYHARAAVEYGAPARTRRSSEAAPAGSVLLASLRGSRISR